MIPQTTQKHVVKMPPCLDLLETVHIFSRQNVTLADILQCLGDEGNDYRWQILYLIAIGDLSPVTTVSRLKNSIATSPFGIEIGWPQLLKFASQFEQVDWIVLVGNALQKDIVVEKNLDECHRINDITLECFDSSFWIVTSHSSALIKRIKNRFHDVRPFTMRRAS